MTANNSKFISYGLSVILASLFVGCGSSTSTSSIDNCTSEHPFTLNFPANLECKLVMITKETAVTVLSLLRSLWKY